MKCPKCSKDYDDSFAFCPFCAEPKPDLTQATPATPPPAEEVVQQAAPPEEEAAVPTEVAAISKKKTPRFSKKTKGVAALVIVLLVIGLAVGLTLGLSGGGTKETQETTTNTTTVTPQESTQDLQIKTVGFSKWQYTNSYNVGGILVNPNKTQGAVQTVLTVNAYGANNVVLGSRQEYVGPIPPGQEMGFSSYASGDAGAVARVEVVPRVTSWQTMSSSPMFTFENTAFLGNKITGVIASGITKNVTKVRVIAVLLDSAGNALGAGFAFVDNVPAGQKVPFEVSLETAVAPATISFYGEVTSLSEVSP